MDTGAIASALAPTLDHDASPADVAKAFEGMLVKEMLASARRSSGGDSPLGGGQFADIIDQLLSDAIAESGGLGLGEQLGFASPTHEAPHVRPAVPFRTTSGFGVRADPFDGSTKTHKGVDLGAPLGTPIHAARDGEVTFAGESGGYGNLVIVRHADGLETRYAHCSSISAHVGDRVVAGDPIAAVGATGRATGPHLHFEVRENGRAIDPSGWMENGGPLNPKVALGRSENTMGTLVPGSTP